MSRRQHKCVDVVVLFLFLWNVPIYVSFYDLLTCWHCDGPIYPDPAGRYKRGGGLGAVAARAWSSKTSRGTFIIYFF